MINIIMPLQHLSKNEARLNGIPKHTIQTILFMKDKYTLKQSRDWLKSHGELYQNYRIEGEHRRFQQNPPIIGAKYYAKKITPQITFIFQEY